MSSKEIKACFVPTNTVPGKYHDLECPFCKHQVDFYRGTAGVLQILYEFCSHVHIWNNGQELAFIQKSKHGDMDFTNVEVKDHYGIKFIKNFRKEPINDGRFKEESSDLYKQESMFQPKQAA